MPSAPDRRPHEIESAAALRASLEAVGNLRDVVVQGVDLGEVDVDWDVVDVCRAVFVACPMPSPDVAVALIRSGAVVVPDLRDDRPYSIFPPRLYTYEDLVAGGADAAIEEWFTRFRHRTGDPLPGQPVEAIAQRLHDTAMSDGIWDLLEPSGGEPLRAVGVMGGHSVARTDPVDEQVVRLGVALARAGLLVGTGGGPGVMEAANLGAYLSAGEQGGIDEALATLAQAPNTGHRDYDEAAERVHASLPAGGESLAIPTWHYGNEPVGRFASHIAKYFANSIREDGLLRVANAGIVFAAGGPGTVQEVFQDAAINAYADPAERAPMVFLGAEHFGGNGIWELACRVAREQEPPFDDLLLLTDDVDEVVRFVA